LSPWQAAVLGTVVLIGGLLAVGGTVAVGSRGWYTKGALHVRAGFADARGVEVGTRVRIRGVDAGEVVSITRGQDEVIMRLRIKASDREWVRTNSTVQIVSEGMLGGKVVEVRPPPRGTTPGPAANEDDLLRSEPTAELGDVLAQISDVLNGVSTGKEGVGRELVAAVRSIKQAADAAKVTLEHSKKAIDKGEEALTAIQQAAEASKRLPLVRSYAGPNPIDLLVRSKDKRHRKVAAEADLFVPGRSELTAAGKAKLDEVGAWMNKLKPRGSEVVVVAYADPARGTNSATAQKITDQQAETVVEYLKDRHSVHSMSWISSRKVIPLGMGTRAAPEPERGLPPARVEMIVFVPRK
jgi:phospholipid/cholesterol/gamma-HCH transport system substrate-binding protein